MKQHCKPLQFILLVLAIFFSTSAQAHKPSDSYLSLRVEENRLSGQWDIALRDLEFAIGLDNDGDGAITWLEVKEKTAAINAYAMARLHLAQNGTPCPLHADHLLIDTHTDGTYAVLQLNGQCKQAIHNIDIHYRLFFDFDTQHKGLLKLTQGDHVLSGIFSPGQAERHFTLIEKNAFQHFGDYTQEGIFHIWAGFDHISFLISLLLPAVMFWQTRPIGPQHKKGHWLPVEKFRPALFEVIKIVTAFTLAHSITLSLATLGMITLPSRLVESVIAFSVLLAALNNLAPRIHRARWAVAFGFGLIHGFGFASVLADLGLPDSALLVALLGFNLGVELGQMAIVASFLPLAYALRCSRFYRQGILYIGSVIIALIAAAWFIERAFDLKLMPF